MTTSTRRAAQGGQLPDDAHFTDKGYEELAESVARGIKDALGGSPEATAVASVICFGDSITASAGAEPDTRWVAVLR